MAYVYWVCVKSEGDVVDEVIGSQAFQEVRILFVMCWAQAQHIFGHHRSHLFGHHDIVVHRNLVLAQIYTKLRNWATNVPIIITVIYKILRLVTCLLQSLTFTI